MEQFDPNKLDLQSLYAASQQSNEAKARALALRDKLAQAKEMQNTNYANQNPSPLGGSYMGGLRDMFNIYEGGSQQRKLQPEYEQAQVQSAEADTKFKLYEEMQKRAKEAEEKRQWNKEYSAFGDDQVYVDPQNPNDLITVYHTQDKGYVDENGNQVDLDGLMPLSEYDDIYGSGAGGGMDMPAAMITLAQNKANRLMQGVRLFKDLQGLTVQDIKTMNSQVPVLMKLIRGMVAPGQIEQHIAEYGGSLSNEARVFIRQLNEMDAAERYELFGATLSKGEDKASQDVLNMLKSRGLAGALDTARVKMRRIRDELDLINTQFKRDWVSPVHQLMQVDNPDSIYQPQYTKFLYGHYTPENFPDPKYWPDSIPPELRTRKEWAALSPEARKKLGSEIEDAMIREYQEQMRVTNQEREAQ